MLRLAVSSCRMDDSRRGLGPFGPPRGIFNGPPSGTGVGARGTSCRWLPDTASLLGPTGRKFRSELAVLAVTRRESGPEVNGFGVAFSTLVVLTGFVVLISLVWFVWFVSLVAFVVVLVFFLAGPLSSPSVPSSYPEVFPSAGFFRGRPRGRPVGALLRELLLDGLDVGWFGAVAGSTGVGATRWTSGAGGPWERAGDATRETCAE